MKRVFIVGCPRSGTTLVQALLARYPGVHSFPETRFFEALLDAVDLQLARLGAERHHVLCLEDMVEDFSRGWQRLCAFLDLDPNAPLSAEPASGIANLADEPWKSNAITGVVRPPSRKSEGLFGPRIRDWMRSSLVPYEDVRAKVARG
jgi:hypothetical protein